MISSLVLTLDSNIETTNVLLNTLESLDSVELGQPFENRLPVVLEADNPQEMESLTVRIRTLPGVVHLDVAYVSLD